MCLARKEKSEKYIRGGREPGEAPAIDSEGPWPKVPEQARVLAQSSPAMDHPSMKPLGKSFISPNSESSSPVVSTLWDTWASVPSTVPAT